MPGYSKVAKNGCFLRLASSAHLTAREGPLSYQPEEPQSFVCSEMSGRRYASNSQSGQWTRMRGSPPSEARQLATTMARWSTPRSCPKGAVFGLGNSCSASPPRDYQAHLTPREGLLRFRWRARRIRGGSRPVFLAAPCEARKGRSP